MTVGWCRTALAMAYRSREYSADFTSPADPMRWVTRPGWPAAAQASVSTPLTMEARAVDNM